MTKEAVKDFKSMNREELLSELKVLYQPKKSVLTHYSDSVPYFRSMVDNKMQEHFMALYLDENKKIIENRVLTIGTLNKTLVHPREVFKYAVDNSDKVSFIIIGHNHPSNVVLPSSEDKEITKNLVKAGDILGLKIIDHVIVTATESYSFYAFNQI